MSSSNPPQYPNNPYSTQATLGSAPAKPSGGGGWKWLIIILGLGGIGIVACCGLCGGLGYFGLSMIKQTPPYQMAMAKVRESAEVNEKLGNPIEDSISFSDEGMQFNERGQEGDAHLSINLKGPKGTAVVSVDAEKAAGAWTLKNCTVTYPDGTSQQLVEGAADNSDQGGEEESGDASSEEMSEAGAAP